MDLLEIGLKLKDEKCVAFSPNGMQDWDLSIPVRSDGSVLLGTPLGNKPFVKVS